MENNEHGFSHLDSANTPRMVDIGGKTVTRRVAEARAVLELSREIAEALHGGDTRFSIARAGKGEGTTEEISTPKGPVFRTAIIAGIMAAKRTHELIPLCHPIPLDKVLVDIAFLNETEIEIRAVAATTHKTGVEMEALHAASTAALTVYDMCKALGHGMLIKEIRLVSKQGGKSDYLRT